MVIIMKNAQKLFHIKGLYSRRNGFANILYCWKRDIPSPIRPACSLAVSPEEGETKFKEIITTTTKNSKWIRDSEIN